MERDTDVLKTVSNSTIRLFGFKSLWLLGLSSLLIGHTSVSAITRAERLGLDEIHAQRSEARAEEDAKNIELRRLREEDRACKSVPLSMRQFFYDKLARTSENMSAKEKRTAVEKYAKVLGMAVKESAGNATSITDMKLRGSAKSTKLFFAENRGLSSGSMLQATLKMRDSLLAMTDIAWNQMTNFGLLQMSADRLALADSNVVIFNRYKDIMKTAPRAALDKCGTQYLYKDPANVLAGEIEEAASCRAGTHNVSEVKCFAKMVTICPALNLELALNAPAAYFATRKAAPRCTEALKEVVGLK